MNKGTISKMPLSKSEAGKLGAEKSRIISSLKKQANIAIYLKDPNYCKCCKSLLTYENRKKIFCSSSCSATYNNKQRKTEKKLNLCVACEKKIHPHNKYCSIKCQCDFFYNKSIVDWFQNKISPSKGKIKKYLIEKFGNVCSVCGISDWNDKPLVLELEHKDGNSENNEPNNLCLICPNCHSQTPTFKGKNKGNGRHIRRKRYAEGKSY